MEHVDLGLLVLRVGVGVTMFLHGWNHVFGGGKLAGTGRWFESMGMKPGWLHARLATATELGAGLLFALGLLTPLAAAGIIALMVVAGITAHRKNGFFIFRPGQGWEYVMILAIAAFAVAAIGAGEWSIDHALDLDVESWWGARHRRRRRCRWRPAVPGGVLAPTPGARDVNDVPGDGAGDGQATTTRRRVRPATVAIGVIIVGFAAMWIYAWFFAPRGNVDRFPDRAWADAAERVCAVTAERRRGAARGLDVRRHRAEGRGPAPAGRGDRRGRPSCSAARSRRCGRTEPADDKSREGVALWLADWDGYLQSRRDQADRLRQGEDRPFVVHEQGGAPVTLRMDAFAKTNGMPSCIVPDDIG